MSGPVCPDCARGLDHCHASLVTHADGSTECLGVGGCDDRPDRHVLHSDCTVLLVVCGC